VDRSRTLNYSKLLFNQLFTLLPAHLSNKLINSRLVSSLISPKLTGPVHKWLALLIDAAITYYTSNNIDKISYCIHQVVLKTYEHHCTDRHLHNAFKTLIKILSILILLFVLKTSGVKTGRIGLVRSHGIKTFWFIIIIAHTISFTSQVN